MSKPSPIDALCERWRKEKAAMHWNSDYLVGRSDARYKSADELSRLAPLVAALVEAGNGMAEALKILNKGGDTSNVWRAALKAYEEGA